MQTSAKQKRPAYCRGEPIASTNHTHDKKRARFSGHQTFTFRYGWLEKGVHSVEESPKIFTQEDAILRLDIGKNMVRSIHYWCLVSQLIEDSPIRGEKSAHTLRVSPIARRIFLDRPWDPFLENDASLWLLHWLIVANPTITTTWQLIFGHFH